MPNTTDNIKVAIRVRPFIASETKNNLSAQWSVQNNNIYQVDETGQKNGELYSFDHVFQMFQSNRQIYDEIVKDFVESALNGLNSTIFAYGQTSSGKTYTMLGDEKDKGLVPLAIDNIFNSILECENRKFLIRVSYVEIYNERINDLLDPNNKDIKIREHFSGTIGLKNVKEEIVSTREQVYECLNHGNENRHIGATNMNDRSSRSHTIFKIVIESAEMCNFESDDCPVQISNLNLVDLAGSERVAQTKATGVRLKEGGHINKSLSALGLVIRQLSDGQEYVNFRDSKLTRLLQHSLGGNAKTLIIATITLASVEYTTSTLSFAQRAKAVKNQPHINEILSDSATSKRYAQLNVQLQSRLEELTKNLERTQEQSSREILRLQEQMQMLETFQHGKKTPITAVIPKRRHTIGHLGVLNAIVEEPEEGVQTMEGVFENHSPKLTLGDLETPITIRKSQLLHSTFSTPKRDLRIRIQALERDYEELATYTRDEKGLLGETSKEVEKLEGKLREEKRKLTEYQKVRKIEEEFLVIHLNTKFKIREEQLLDKIASLEEQLNIKNENNNCSNSDFILRRPSDLSNRYPLDNYDDITYLHDQLLVLQDILKHCNLTETFDSALERTKLDANHEIVESFNAKIKTLKEIMESEIWKQVNSFNQIVEELREPVVFPNEIESFDKLLNELSAFENGISMELINNGEHTEHVKILFRIYESLIKKNELIGWCSKKILSLQEEQKISEDRQKIEQNHLKSRIDELNLFIETKDKNLCELRNTICLLESAVTELKEKSDALANENNKPYHEEIIAENSALKFDIKKIKEEFNIKIQQLEENNDIVNNKVNCLQSQLNWSEGKLLECLQTKEDLKLELEKVSKLNNLHGTYLMKIKTLEDSTVAGKYSTFNDDFESVHSKISAIVASNTELIETLLKRLSEYETKCVLYEEKLALLNDTNKNRTDEVNRLNKQIDRLLNSYKKESEKLVLEVEKYKLDLKECDEQLKVYEHRNIGLESQVKALNDELVDYKNNYSTSQYTIKEKDIFVEKLNQTKKKFECILCGIIEYFVKEIRALLLKRHTQEQRDYFKSIRKDVKDNSTILKSQLNLFLNQDSYNMDETRDALLKSSSILKEYSNLEKSLLESQIELLDKNNKTYLQEISVLKKTQEETIRSCLNCDLLQNQLSDLDKRLAYKERMLTETLSKLQGLQQKSLTKSVHEEMCSKCEEHRKTNVQLQKVLNEQIKQNRKLYIQMDEDREKKVEIKQLEIMDTYKRNIDRLRKQVRDYENALKDRKCAEVQCNLLEVESVMQQKYQQLKEICQSIKNELLASQEKRKEMMSKYSEIQGQLEIQTKKVLEYENSSTIRRSSESNESLLQRKYNEVKLICQSRRNEILELRARNLEMQNQLEIQKKAMETKENTPNNGMFSQMKTS